MTLPQEVPEQLPSFEEVRRLNHEQGLTLKEIARQHGMSWDTVRRMFRAHGVSWLSRQDFQRAVRAREFEQVRVMRDVGKSLKEIAAALETHPRRIARIISESSASQ